MNDIEHTARDHADMSALIGEHAEALSSKLQRLRRKDTPGPSAKPLRGFSTAEAAKFLGIQEGYLRTLALEGKGAHPAAGSNGRRIYTAEQIHDLRPLLEQTARSGHRYVLHRRGLEHLQMIAVVNFKGGSCKTTTCANLVQYLALRGHRVLAVDLDPQASLTALCGYQPELDIGAYESLLGAVDYNDPKPLADIIRKTNIPGLDLVPANIELSEFEFITAKVLGSGQASAASYFTRLEDALAPVSGRLRCGDFRLPAAARLSHHSRAMRGDGRACDHSSANAGSHVDEPVSAHDALEFGAGAERRRQSALRLGALSYHAV